MSKENMCSRSANNGKSAKKQDLSFCDIAVDFDRLRISALTKAAEISPQVKEVTIGPNSPIKKEIATPKEDFTLDSKAEKVSPKEIVADDLQYTAVMKLCESQLKQTSDAIFNDLIYKMLAKRAEYMKKFWIKQSETCELRALELKSRKQQMIKNLRETDSLTVSEKSTENEQNSEYMHMKTIENMNRILEEQNKAATRFAAITNSHTRICICYNEIGNLVEIDEFANKISHKFIKLMNNTVNSINKLMDFSKNGNISELEVHQGEELAASMDSIKKSIVDESNQLKHQKQLQKQQEEAKRKHIELQKQKELEARTLEATKQAGTLFYSEANYKRYEELKTFLSTFESTYKSFTEDPSTKKFRFDCQKAVNTPVNAIASVSGTHLRDKYEKLAKLLRGERVQVLDTYVTLAQHPQSLYFCTALLAKKIVLQGASLVSCQPEAAFPLAAVTVALWAQFPDLGYLLEANFHKECPYLVPMFLPQKQGMTEKDFYLSRGYIYTDGLVEKQDKFLKRMSGIFTLCCAIWITTPPRFVNAGNLHGLKFAWKWLASFLNLKPEPDICATLLYDFFTVCGSDFNKSYGIQFTKIIKLIVFKYLEILEKIDNGGPKTRLEVLLHNILKTGHIPPPAGLLPANMW